MSTGNNRHGIARTEALSRLAKHCGSGGAISHRQGYHDLAGTVWLVSDRYSPPHTVYLSVNSQLAFATPGCSTALEAVLSMVLFTLVRVAETLPTVLTTLQTLFQRYQRYACASCRC